jgi:Small-conductance mechanosensitive channel
MADAKQAFDWQHALTETYADITQQMIAHIPQIVGALVLLIAGWILAWVLRVVAQKLVKGLEALFLRTALKRGLPQSSVRSYAALGGDIVFWSVLLFFVAASANMLDWKIFSGISTALLTYLPNVLTGLLIILAGFALSGVARSAVAGAAESTGVAQVDLLARIAQITVLLTAIVIGVEQLGINVAFLTTTLIVVAGVLLGGAALAFGLGAKHFVANIIGAQTMRKLYQIGQLVKIGDVEGYLLEITPTSVVLDTEKGRAAVPAKLFHEQVSHIITESQEGSGSFMGNLFQTKGDHDAFE